MAPRTMFTPAGSTTLFARDVNMVGVPTKTAWRLARKLRPTRTIRTGLRQPAMCRPRRAQRGWLPFGSSGVAEQWAGDAYTDEALGGSALGFAETPSLVRTATAQGRYAPGIMGIWPLG